MQRLLVRQKWRNYLSKKNVSGLLIVQWYALSWDMERKLTMPIKNSRRWDTVNRRYAYLIVPYLFNQHRYHEIVAMCKQREQEMEDQA